MSPTEAQVLEIRRQSDAGTLNVREWAEVLDVSLETVRRIGRRDTYRKLGRSVVRTLPPIVEEDGPPDAEIEASLARLRGLADRLPEGPQAAEAAIEGLKGGSE